jgi:hypothetical protein
LKVNKEGPSHAFEAALRTAAFESV